MSWSSASRSTTSSCRSSTGPAFAATRSPPSPPGRTCCSSARSRSCSSSTGRRGLRLEGPDRLARGRVRRLRRPLRAAPAVDPRWRGDPQGRPVRHAARPAPCARVLPRLASRAHGTRAPQSLPDGAARPRPASPLYGLLDVYLVPLSWWRQSAGWFSDQLGLSYTRPLGPARELRLQRRAAGSSSGDSPRRSSRRSRPATSSSSRCSSSRCAAVARAGRSRCCSSSRCSPRTRGLRCSRSSSVCSCSRRCGARRSRPCSRCSSPSSVSSSSSRIRISRRGRTSRASELRQQEANAHRHPHDSNDATSANESSTSEHLASLRAGIRTVRPPSVGVRRRERRRDGGAHERQGRGGRVDLHRARRRDRACSAPSCSSPGRSRCSFGCARVAWFAAAFAAMAFVALQTDMIGIPWLAVALFALAGAEVSRERNFSATFE